MPEAPSCEASPHRSSVTAGKVTETAVVGGVDTHKDLHVAAVVDQNNKVLGTQFSSTTRQGYRQMLTWMTSFGALKRIGV
ncbi:IS110 family transposase, partial [Escherichia coli]|nr:IS110 family transposase [Escherichia coli]